MLDCIRQQKLGVLPGERGSGKVLDDVSGLVALQEPELEKEGCAVSCCAAAV